MVTPFKLQKMKILFCNYMLKALSAFDYNEHVFPNPFILGSYTTYCFNNLVVLQLLKFERFRHFKD